MTSYSDTKKGSTSIFCLNSPQSPAATAADCWLTVVRASPTSSPLGCLLYGSAPQRGEPRVSDYSTVFFGTSMPLPNLTSRAAATRDGRP